MAKTKAKRVPQEEEQAPELSPLKETKEKRPALQVIVNKDFDERQNEIEKIEEEFGETPKAVGALNLREVKIFHSRVKMLRAFESRFHNELKLGEKPEIAVLHAEKHAEVDFYFKGAHVVNLEESGKVADYKRRHGMEAEKFDPTMQLGKPVNLMIAFYDTDVEANWRLARNVKLGGWLLCKSDMAQKLLENTNDFKCMGTMDEHGSQNFISKSKTDAYWEHAVKNDAEFKAASARSGLVGSEVVTYEEAKMLMDRAKWPYLENYVLRNYKALVEHALKDPNNTRIDKDGIITYKDPKMDEPVRLRIQLPFGLVSGSLIFILKKKREGES